MLSTLCTAQWGGNDNHKNTQNIFSFIIEIIHSLMRNCPSGRRGKKKKKNSWWSPACVLKAWLSLTWLGSLHQTRRRAFRPVRAPPIPRRQGTFLAELGRRWCYSIHHCYLRRDSWWTGSNGTNVNRNCEGLGVTHYLFGHNFCDGSIKCHKSSIHLQLQFKRSCRHDEWRWCKTKGRSKAPLYYNVKILLSLVHGVIIFVSLTSVRRETCLVEKDDSDC